MFRKKNTEKYITFTVPIEKEDTRIDKNGEEITKNISNILQFVDSAKLIFLMEFIELSVNSDMTIKNVKHVELNMSITTVFLNIQILKMI